MQKTDKILKEQYVPSAEFYSQVIDSLQDYSIFTVDTKLNINSWNSGATQIFQYETDDIIGKPFETIFTEEDKEKDIPKKEIETASKKGRSKDVRWHVCKDGTTFYADGLVFPLKDNKNETIGFVKILRDITAKKAAEDAVKKYAKELEELNAHKENVLAILSHDLRSPLAAIIQGVEFLELNIDTMETPFVKELLQEFQKAVVNELEMLDYLVEWARIKYAAEAFAPTEIQLIEYVEKVFKSLKESAAINMIHLHNQIEEHNKVFADEKMLISIIQNIVSNAIKHSHKGGQITLSAKKGYGMMIVEIKDTGTGMSKETQDTLFTPQVKSLSRAVEEKQGMGIGLLLVKGFLEKNGGHIWVESTEGKGSSFYFTLPLNKPADKMDVFGEVKTDDSR
ncbi:PAS domain-containing sensor histidine kinase [Flavobacterium terrisoli]|uniref:PAS domain-containing sensor histidine kinase n=1 Tax=Flavobacterium terrisoli TaxID=3242195 RepID=UPI002542A5F5|nr:PAS domain-containing sensor histidine kinase [Flavobacterium buctense]